MDMFEDESTPSHSRSMYPGHQRHHQEIQNGKSRQPPQPLFHDHRGPPNQFAHRNSTDMAIDEYQVQRQRQQSTTQMQYHPHQHQDQSGHSLQSGYPQDYERRGNSPNHQSRSHGPPHGPPHSMDTSGYFKQEPQTFQQLLRPDKETKGFPYYQVDQPRMHPSNAGLRSGLQPHPYGNAHASAAPPSSSSSTPSSQSPTPSGPLGPITSPNQAPIGATRTTREGGVTPRIQHHAPLEPEVTERLNKLFFEFLERICSDCKWNDVVGIDCCCHCPVTYADASN